MALSSATAVSRCSSPLSVPAATGAIEAAQAPLARVQTTGRSVSIQKLTSFMTCSSASSAFSSVKEARGGQTGEGNTTLDSLLHIVVSESEKSSSDSSNSITSGAAGKAVSHPTFLGVTPCTGRDIGPQASSSAAAGVSSQVETHDYQLLHTNTPPAGAISSTALLHEFINTNVTNAEAKDPEDSASTAGECVLQDSDSCAQRAHGDDTAGQSCVPYIDTLTEERDVSGKGIDAAALDKKDHSSSEKTSRLDARTRSRAGVRHKRHDRDITGSNITENTRESEKNKKTDNSKDNTNNSVILMSDSGSTSPCTPSTVPSAEPSPSFCLSQSLPAMLIRSGQAALPSPVTEFCYEGRKSINVEVDDAVGGRACGGDKVLSVVYEKGGEKEASGMCTQERGKKQQHGSNAGDVEKQISTWDVYEKSVETEDIISSATPSPAADSSSGVWSAASRSLEEQISETDTARPSISGVTTNMENSHQQAKQENPVLRPSTSSEPTRSPTAPCEVIATGFREAEVSSLHDSRMQQKALSPAVDDTSETPSSCQSHNEKEQARPDALCRTVHAIEGSAAASAPLSLSQREDSSDDTTVITAKAITEQVVDRQVCVQQPHEESGESNGFTGATCFLQKLQQWEPDVDSRCNALLSQLSIPLPAREKLLQNTAPLLKKSRRAELTDASSFLMSGEEACLISPTPFLSSSAAVITPATSSARSNSNSIKLAALHTTSVAASQEREASVPTSLVECRRLCGCDCSLPARCRTTTTATRPVAGGRGAQQQQQIERHTPEQQLMETLLKGQTDTTGDGTDICLAPECHHGVHASRLLAPAAAMRGHTKEVHTKTCHGPGGILANMDMPCADESNDSVAAATAAAAQVLQHQLRHQGQEQQQHSSDLQEGSIGHTHMRERQQYVRASENWTRCGVAAAVDDVLRQSSSIAEEGHRAADEESLNIRRWFESFGVAGRRAETAVAAVVKRAVDLQRRLATLLTVTLRQQLNQRLLVLALAILLEKHRREPVRCEEMLREQQRLLRVLETQQQQALADLPHLYGDLPEAQQLQQQLQQLREAEWQLRTGGDRVAVAQAGTEEHTCHHVSRDSDLCLLPSSHAHCLPDHSSCRVRAPAAAAAAIEGTARMFYPSGSLVPCTQAVQPEGGSARWAVCMHYQAERKGRLAAEDNSPEMLALSTTTETPTAGVLGATGVARPATLPPTEYVQSLTNGSTSEAAVMLSGADGSCVTSTAMAAELLAARRHSRHTNSSLACGTDFETRSREKQVSRDEGSGLLHTQQPIIERFLVKQIARCLAGSVSDTGDAASASSEPKSSTASTSGVLELANVAAGTTKESWRSGTNTSNFGTYGDEGTTTARGKPARNSISTAAINSPVRLRTGNNNARSDASPEQSEGGGTARAAAASEGSKSSASGAGRQSASLASALRGAAAAGSAEASSPRPVKTAEDSTAAAEHGTAERGAAERGIAERGTAEHGIYTPSTGASGTATSGAAGQTAKGPNFPVARTQAGPLHSSSAENNQSSCNNNFTPGASSDVSLSGNFTSVYSRGSNARHPSDPYPHHVMIQLIQPLPTGIKLELKSHRPASLGSAQGPGALSGSNSITSLSSANVDVPAPREYALRVSLTRHETKYCSFHSLHGILPAYNEAVRLRNKFAGLPFVLPSMTLKELHQRKEQLDAGRPLPGHGPHEAFMTVQERITYYKQTGISGTNNTKAENTSGSASSSSVFCSPRSASPSSSVAPAGGRPSQNAAPVVSGNSGNSSASKARNFRSSSTSSPAQAAEVGAGAAPAVLNGEHYGRSNVRGASSDEQQHPDQLRGTVGRGGGTSGGKRGRTLSVSSSRQQESQGSWSSVVPPSMTQQHPDGDQSSNYSHVPRLAARAGKSSTSVPCRPLYERHGSARLHERKMQLRSRTTSSSGSRSDGTTISSATETESVKESGGAAEDRDRGEKRRKISNEAEDVIQSFLQRNLYKNSNSEPDEGVSSSSQASDPGAYPLRPGDLPAAQSHSPGADLGNGQAGSTAEGGDDLKQTLTRTEGSRKGGGGHGTARYPWGDLFSWESPLSPLCAHQSPGEAAAVGSQSFGDTGSATTEDLELLTQELRRGDQLRALLDKELLVHHHGGTRPSPRRLPVPLTSSRPRTLVECDWLPCLHASDGGSGDGQAGGEARDATDNGRRTEFRESEACPEGSSSSSNFEIDAGEAPGLLGITRTDGSREGATVDHEGDNRLSRAPSRNSGRRNSNGLPTHKARNMEKHTQDTTWAGDLQLAKTHQSEGARQVERRTAGSRKVEGDQKCDVGEQEVDISEEEARNLSELLLGTRMFGDMSRCSDEAEEKRLAQGSERQSRTAGAAAASTGQQPTAAGARIT